VVKQSATVPAGPNFTSDLIVVCPSGTRPIGGGVQQTTVPALQLVSLYPADPVEGPYFHVGLTNQNSTSRTVILYAICASVS
jgi:hypothetical protein